MKIIGGLFEMMEARRRRRNIEAALFFGVGCGALLICGLIVVIVGSIMNAVESGAVNDLYGEAYAQACQPVPGGDDDLDNLPDVAKPHQILLLTGDTQRRHAWHNDLPSQWQAENEKEVILIGCVEETTTVIETCEYQRAAADGDGSFTIRIDREQHETTLTLINPETGRRIDTLTMTGSEPEKCPDDEDVTGSGDVQGSDVVWDDFASWVEGYVFE